MSAAARRCCATSRSRRPLDRHARRSASRVAGVGVAVPENVSVTGRITSSAVMPALGQAAGRRAARCDRAAAIDADVRAAAFAEATLGAGQDYGFHAFMTISTGISYCAVVGGRPFAGAHGGALHMGTSVFALPSAPPASTAPRSPARAPDLGQRRSARSSERYAALGRLRDQGRRGARRAAGGDEAARDVVDSGARALGMGIALLLNVLDPEAVITGGGLGCADTEYWSRPASGRGTTRTSTPADAGDPGTARPRRGGHRRWHHGPAGRERPRGGHRRPVNDNGYGTNTTQRKK